MDNHPIALPGLEPSELEDDTLVEAAAEHLAEVNEDGRQEDHT